MARETNKIMSDFEQVLIEEDSKFKPPMCHFKPMRLEASDDEEWFECDYCGHVEEVGFMGRPF